MIALSLIIALTSSYLVLCKTTHIKCVYKREGCGLVFLCVQLMHQPPIDQGLCDIKVSAK